MNKEWMLLEANKMFFTIGEAESYADNILKLKKYTIVNRDSNKTFEYELTNTGYMYRLTSLEAGSNKYGKCKICDRYISEVYLQVEFKVIEDKYKEDPSVMEFTTYGCNDIRGCKECLIKARK